MSKEIPKGISYELKQVEAADDFHFDGFIKPNGRFVGVPTVKEEAAGKIEVELIMKPNQISTNSATYQEVTSWTVSKTKAYLDNLSFCSDTPATAQWKLLINGTAVFEDEKIQNILDALVPEVDYKSGDKIQLYMKSDGAITIVADGYIQGRQIGE